MIDPLPPIGPDAVAAVVAGASLADLLAACDPIADTGPLGAAVAAEHRAAGVHRCPECRRRSAAVADADRAWCARCGWRGTRSAVAGAIAGDPGAIVRLLRASGLGEVHP